MVGYQWVDFEKDTDATTLLATTGFTADDLPVVICPDGKVVSRPDRLDLARHLGIQVAAKQELYDVVVIGAGPAGLAAAVYGASEGLKTIIVEKQTPGGQAGSSSRIENYLGFPTGLSGAELAHRAWTQATRLGAEFMAPQEVVNLCIQDGYKIGQTPNIEILPHTQVREACGGNSLEAVVIQRDGQEPEKHPARALFIFIGAKPSTEWICDLALCDTKGYLLTGRDLVNDPRYATSWKKTREP
nr:NADPH-dependent thioredoxin reductase 3 [Tanacetum cinerariifolium]